jgi:hypothetical protein
MQQYLKLILCLSVSAHTGVFAQAPESQQNKQLVAMVQAGPMSPDTLRDSFALPDSALARYTLEYRQHLTKTKAQRDEAILALKATDADEAGRGYRSRAVRALLREDGSFEHIHLMPLLTPEQRSTVLRSRGHGMRSTMRARAPRS